MRYAVLIFSIVFMCLQQACYKAEGRQATSLLPDTVSLSALPVVPESSQTADMADKAYSYCKSHRMHTDFCLLLDMSRHSGLPRCYIWNFKDRIITDSGLVSHGCGNNPWGETYSAAKPVFSNKAESHCSSLGKYKIGDRKYSEWGIHVKYILHGLDSSNSNALSRLIVLHSWAAVPDNAVYPQGTPEGWGCPALSDKFMTRLDTMLQNSPRPVLLWMYR